MTPRLTSEFRVKALLRRVHDAGGSAMVLAKGDAMAGAILIVALERGQAPTCWERDFAGTGITRCGPADTDPQDVDAYWRRRRQSDPDLWVIELDIAAAERFAAETIASN
ncbi:DUF1491 family protein [uncultured Sphingomonas sp.]|uniref:DUF1491 family protein n=1 Tax=uncultured Sphingomonas sp. TaxID=158754 RepID=UPI0025F4711B|nr:DUF1491 family protein [uncultured Sphingomonas sp.]